MDNNKIQKINELWDKLRNQGANNEELLDIIENIPELRDKAWKELLKNNPTNNNLRFIIEKIESLRAKLTPLKPGTHYTFFT